MKEHVFTALFPFGGLGAGARGFLDAEVNLLGTRFRFESVGGVDLDADACRDFEYLTGTPQLEADVTTLDAEAIRKRFGVDAPDVVFMSPPCKGASGLLPARLAGSEKYSRMNDLAMVWTRLMLEAWSDAPPRLVLLENVPRLRTRAASTLDAVKSDLRRAGYKIHEGFHDCGEIGGLAQRRRRYLLVARHSRRCGNLLYQPPMRRVRGCGEVLGALPVPGSVEAFEFGKIHELPKITWQNWVRLALIPPGGDWRDIDGVLAEHQKRRELFRRHVVANWTKPVGTIAGSGSNSVANCADPRLPGVNWFGGVLGVRDWFSPAPTVTGRAGVTTGAFAVVDTRVRSAFDAGYAVLSWEQHARTIAGTSAVGCGAYSVAEPRKIVFNLGLDDALTMSVSDSTKPPPFVPVIESRDGTWHRPMTTLELAALQGIPSRWRGAPLRLSGDSHSAWRERIGNAVPVGAARAIAEKMLVTLGASHLETFTLDAGAIWVEKSRENGVAVDF